MVPTLVACPYPISKWLLVIPESHKNGKTSLNKVPHACFHLPEMLFPVTAHSLTSFTPLCANHYGKEAIPVHTRYDKTPCPLLLTPIFPCFISADLMLFLFLNLLWLVCFYFMCKGVLAHTYVCVLCVGSTCRSQSQSPLIWSYIQWEPPRRC